MVAQLRADFETDAQGWSVYSGGPLEWTASGGMPGGFITGFEGGSGVWYFEASDAWRGDLSEYFGATLTYWEKIANLSVFDADDILIVGTNGLTLAYNFDQMAGAEWTAFSVTLDDLSGWRKGSSSGAIASRAEILSVLQDVAAFRIRGEYGYGGDNSSLDSVVLTPAAPEPEAPAADEVVSRFRTGTEGWSHVGDVDSYRWHDSGGNGGGYVEAVDRALGGTWYFVAPDKFLGGKRGFYNGVLAYDLKQSATDSQFDAADVIITGANGTTLAIDTPYNPGTDWTNYRIALNDRAGWKLGDLSGSDAGAADIKAVLADIAGLQIRGEFVVGGDTGGLDNVILRAPVKPYDLYADSSRAELLGTGSDLQGILDLARDGNAVEIEAPTDGVFRVDSGIDILANGMLSGRIILGDAAGGLFLVDGRDLRIIGSAGDEVIDSSGDNLVVVGGAGDDLLSVVGSGNRLFGKDGNDTLQGGDQADVLFGNAGRDILSGFEGNDQLAGGGAADLFQFSLGTGIDRIRDFLPGVDEIRMTGYGIADFADLTLVQASDGVRVRAGGDQIVLVGLTLADIQQGDFSFL